MEIAREEIKASNEKIEADFSELGYCVNLDPDYEYDVAFFPEDEINAIRKARKNWQEPGRIEEDKENMLVIERAQATKGQTRRNIAIIRYEGGCVVYGAD